MGRVAGDQDPAILVGVSDSKTQVPEPDIANLEIKLGANRLVEVAVEVEAIFGRVLRHRCVEEPLTVRVHAPHELPIAFELWVECVIERAVGKSA